MEIGAGVNHNEPRAIVVTGMSTDADLQGSLTGKKVESLVMAFAKGIAYLHLYSDQTRSIAVRGAIG